MPSHNLVAALARSAALAALIVWPGPAAWATPVAATAPALDGFQQPRDPRTDVPRPESAREQELRSATATDPRNVANWLELAKLQEVRGAIADAERTFKMAVDAAGANRSVLMAQASFFTRDGRFDRAVESLEAAADLDPTDPAGHHLVATYYWEKSFKDHTITPAEKLKYIDAGLAATDRALALRAAYPDAMTYKNILLRMKAQLEPDAARRDALIAEAETWSAQAIASRKTTATSQVAPGAPAPPQPPTGLDAPVRVGGNIKTPTKVQHVSPVYPPEAMNARVAGMVILEVLIDVDGNVTSATVLRSIPLLDDAAVDAVKQWRFTPTLLNGAPVPVIMTVTVNFTLQ